MVSLALSILAQAPKRAWCQYLSILESKPGRTKIATSVAAAFLGDMMAQRMDRAHLTSDGKFRPDFRRTATLCAFNGGMGLFGHYYFSALDRGFPLVSKTAASRGIQAVQKTFIDQFVAAPIATLCFYALKVTAERRPKEYREEIRQKYVPTLLAGWQLWVPAHVVNFLFVATQHRVLYTNVVAVGGTYVLSKASNMGGDIRGGKKDKGRDRDGGGAAPEYEILSDCCVRVD